MKCLKNLIAMANDHDVSVTSNFIESLSKWLQEDGEDYLPGRNPQTDRSSVRFSIS